MPARPRILAAAVTTALLTAACGSSAKHQPASSAQTQTQSTGQTPTQTTAQASTPGPEGIPLEQGADLAPASSTTQGQTVDGVHCQASEQAVYHIHAHLQVYVDGQSRAVPGAIGMVGPVSQQTAYGAFYGAQGCYYWLHTHASDGVIHVESPTARVYTLGNFFDEWRQPLSASQVASARGKVTAIVNGKPWTKSPRDIPLTAHASIQLSVGSPSVPFHPVPWSASQL